VSFSSPEALDVGFGAVLKEATEVITCQKCGKENQDHYKFCLGCGAELSREAAPKPFAPEALAQADTTQSYAEHVARQPAAPVPMADATHASPGIAGANNRNNYTPGPPRDVAPVAPAAAQGFIDCPQCKHQNPVSNRFCASCGYKLNVASVPVKPAYSAPPAAGETRLTALRADGSEAGSYTLPGGQVVTVGRDTGSIFAGDSYLSPRHATFTRKNDHLVVDDAGSLNGVYLKIRPNTPWTLRFGDVFRIGQEILRLERLEGPGMSADGVQRFGSPVDGYVGRLALVIGRDTTGNAFPIPKTGFHLGRERGDVLFPEDGYVSGLHCRLAVGADGTISLTDLGSSNGSFVRLKEEHQVSSGDILLMGQQLFRVDS
jgi:pSer/pThr/pTyr-binding forkhead associated (FHA) protein